MSPPGTSDNPVDIEPGLPLVFRFRGRRYELVADNDDGFFVLRDYSGLPLIVVPISTNCLRVYRSVSSRGNPWGE